MAKLDPRMLSLVPWDYAWKRWSEVPPDERYDYLPQRWMPARLKGEAEVEVPPAKPEPVVTGPGCCPACGWPQGVPGFVRVTFPVRHELFGRPVCCRRCWPYPFGHAAGIVQGEIAIEIAELWERSHLLDGIEYRPEPEVEPVPAWQDRE